MYEVRETLMAEASAAEIQLSKICLGFLDYWQPWIVTSISCSDQSDCSGCDQQHFHALQIQHLGNFFSHRARIWVSAQPPHAAASFAGHESAARPTASCSSGKSLGSAHLLGVDRGQPRPWWPYSVKCVGLGGTELGGLLVARRVALGSELPLPWPAFGWSARNRLVCTCCKCSFGDNPTLLCWSLFAYSPPGRWWYNE